MLGAAREISRCGRVVKNHPPKETDVKPWCLAFNGRRKVVESRAGCRSLVVAVIRSAVVRCVSWWLRDEGWCLEVGPSQRAQIAPRLSFDVHLARVCRLEQGWRTRLF